MGWCWKRHRFSCRSMGLPEWLSINSHLRARNMSENEGQNEMGRRKKPDNAELKMKGFDFFFFKGNYNPALRPKEEGSKDYQAGKTKLGACFMDFKVVLCPSKNPEKRSL